MDLVWFLSGSCQISLLNTTHSVLTPCTHYLPASQRVAKCVDFLENTFQGAGKAHLRFVRECSAASAITDDIALIVDGDCHGDSHFNYQTYKKPHYGYAPQN